MGNSLHNKIRLGRAPALASRAVQLAIVLAAFASIGAAWLVVRTVF